MTFIYSYFSQIRRALDARGDQVPLSKQSASSLIDLEIYEYSTTDTVLYDTSPKRIWEYGHYHLLQVIQITWDENDGPGQIMTWIPPLPQLSSLRPLITKITRIGAGNHGEVDVTTTKLARYGGPPIRGFTDICSSDLRLGGYACDKCPCGTVIPCDAQ